MGKLLSILDGKKTYIVALITVVYAIAGGYLGYLDWKSAIDMILAALGAIGFRSAMNK